MAKILKQILLNGDITGGVSDGDKGDISVSNSGTIWTIDNNTVTESKMNLSDNTIGNVSVAKHGFIPKLPNDSAKFLNGTGQWVNVPGGGGLGTAVSIGNNIITATTGLVVGNSNDSDGEYSLVTGELNVSSFGNTLVHGHEAVDCQRTERCFNGGNLGDNGDTVNRQFQATLRTNTLSAANNEVFTLNIVDIGGGVLSAIETNSIMGIDIKGIGLIKIGLNDEVLERVSFKCSGWHDQANNESAFGPIENIVSVDFNSSGTSILSSSFISSAVYANNQFQIYLNIMDKRQTAIAWFGENATEAGFNGKKILFNFWIDIYEIYRVDLTMYKP